ncbi:hypothetical protein GC096_06065 [Paenibacillus sp. LMG 31461]|uniref:Uncharacterized protein n=1 Tax=Paenibacillus plantarum TaxID=2654975 RepID=A0ABX1X599_9BACL|nr:hypothetical protein [Paenibacillus plantarum]NOU63588.1 hypothetical protein [Paenibacillus plantarum]
MEDKKKGQKTEIEVTVKPIINVNVGNTSKKKKKCCACSATVNSFNEADNTTFRIQICPNCSMEGSSLFVQSTDIIITSSSFNLPKCYTTMEGDTVLEVSGSGFANFIGLPFQGTFTLMLVERAGVEEDDVLFAFAGIGLDNSTSTLLGSIHEFVPDEDLSITPCNNGCSCGSPPPVVQPTSKVLAATGKPRGMRRMVIVKPDGEVITR